MGYRFFRVKYESKCVKGGMENLSFKIGPSSFKGTWFLGNQAHINERSYKLLSRRLRLPSIFMTIVENLSET